MKTSRGPFVSGRTEWAWLSLVVAAGVAIYANSIRAGFTFDDFHSIRGHIGVHGPLSFRNIFLRDYWGLPFEHTVGSWRPVATLTYWFDWHIGNGSPWIFHVTNLLCWAALLVLVHLFLRRWAGNALGPRARLLTVAAFAALAIHVDVVPTATGRTELLAMGFSLASLCAVTNSRKGLRAPAVAVSCLLLALALLSKESAFPMTLVVPWMAWRFHQRTASATKARLAMLTAMSLAVLAGIASLRVGRLPFIKTSPEVLSDNPIHAMGWFDQRLAASEVLTHYAEHTLTGLDLVPDYSYSAIHVLVDGVGPRTVVGLLIVLASAALAFRFRQSRPHITDVVVAFWGAYLVASHMVVPASAMVADRLFFFPSFWVVLLGALLLGLVPSAARGREASRLGTRGILSVGAAAWMIVQAVLAASAATNWRDDGVLLTQAIQTYPHVARTRANLAKVLHLAGHHEEAAWNILLAHSYYARFPHPIAQHEFPLHWDDLPVADRLHALRQQEGEHPFLDAIDRTIDSCSAWNLNDTATVLKDWRTKADSQNR